MSPLAFTPLTRWTERTARRAARTVARAARAYHAAIRAEEAACTLAGAWRLATVSQRCLLDLQAARAGRPLPSDVARAVRAARTAARTGFAALATVGRVVAAAFTRAGVLTRKRAARVLTRALRAVAPPALFAAAPRSFVLAETPGTSIVWRRDALVDWLSDRSATVPPHLNHSPNEGHTPCLPPCPRPLPPTTTSPT